MARPKLAHPTAVLVRRGNKQAIRWTHGRISYQLAAQNDPVAAARELAEINLSLVTGQWPAWAAKLPTVSRYVADTTDGPGTGNESMIQRFAAWGEHNLTKKYLRGYLSRVKELADWAHPKTLSGISRTDALAYLDWVRSSPPDPTGTTRRILNEMKPGETCGSRELCARIFGTPTASQLHRVAGSLKHREDLFERVKRGTYRLREHATDAGRSPATRNRALAHLRKFYGWALGQALVHDNPFTGIQDLPEDLPDEIVWCDREERDRIIAAAVDLGVDTPVVIAFYSGLRFGEIARLRWIDVNLTSGWIAVGRDQATRTKTGRARQVPIAEALKTRLLEIPEKQRKGTVCKFRENPYHDRDAILSSLKKRLPELAAKIGFNAWRHTFCSLLAQTGKISIDQIAAISGHTPEVCRRHYAHIIPRDKAAIGIDLL